MSLTQTKHNASKKLAPSLAIIIDMPSGVSGDMLVAGLLELTGEEHYLRGELKKLTGGRNNLSPILFTTQMINKQGIVARQIAFEVPQNAEWELGAKQDLENGQQTSHRHLKDIHQLLDRSNLSPEVIKRSKKIFDILGEAEGKVHGVPKEKVHFHEVGSLDAIADVVSVVVLLEKLKVNQLYSSPILIGQGTVSCAHGLMPVPVPAVVKMLEKYSLPIHNVPQETGELSTPTGVAILCELVGDFNIPRQYISLKSAFGAGQREIPGQVNVLRIRLVDTAVNNEKIPKMEDMDSDEVWQIETNIDDMTPEALAPFGERVLQSGALDFWLESIIMKKGRLGHKLTALATEKHRDEILYKMLHETSTLGVRYFPVDRMKFKRKEKHLKIEGHTVRVKLALRGDQVYKWKAEAKDVVGLCRKKSLTWNEAQSLILKEVPSNWHL